MVPEVRGDSRKEGKTDSREGAREVPGKKEAMKEGRRRRRRKIEPDGLALNSRCRSGTGTVVSASSGLGVNHWFLW